MRWNIFTFAILAWNNFEDHFVYGGFLLLHFVHLYLQILSMLFETISCRLVDILQALQARFFFTCERYTFIIFTKLYLSENWKYHLHFSAGKIYYILPVKEEQLNERNVKEMHVNIYLLSRNIFDNWVN